MSDRQDPVDRLLQGLQVPALAPDFAARVVAEAGRPGRSPAAAVSRGRWRRRRRAAWTTIVAVNILVASAVAAAFGGGGRLVPETVVAATHRLVEQFSPHIPALHHAAAPHRRVSRRPLPVVDLRPRPVMRGPFLVRPRTVQPPPRWRHPGRARRFGPSHARPGQWRPHRVRWPAAAHRRCRQDRWAAGRPCGPWAVDRLGRLDRPGWRGRRWRDGPSWHGPRSGRPWRGPRGGGPGRRRF